MTIHAHAFPKAHGRLACTPRQVLYPSVKRGETGTLGRVDGSTIE